RLHDTAYSLGLAKYQDGKSHIAAIFAANDLLKEIKLKVVKDKLSGKTERFFQFPALKAGSVEHLPALSEVPALEAKAQKYFDGLKKAAPKEPKAPDEHGSKPEKPTPKREEPGPKPEQPTPKPEKPTPKPEEPKGKTGEPAPQPAPSLDL